jgi:c-type cytochrome biogenesis protein CcmF
MMVGQIQTIEQFETAMSLMRAGTGLLYAGMIFTVLLFFTSLYAVWRKDERLVHAARRGQYALLLITSLCCGLIYLGIFDGYYFVGYIRDVTENSETVPFKIAGLWARQQGSLLFWCLILCTHGSIYAFTQRHNRTDRRLPFALVALCAVEFFFFFIMCNPESFDRSNPFAIDYSWMLKADWAAIKAGPVIAAGQSSNNPDVQELLLALVKGGAGNMTFAELHTAITTNASSLPVPVQQWLLENVSDGKGMNPQLHNYWVAIHPPILYLGFVGFTIPFIYALGALFSGDVNEGWLRPIRVWAMSAWGLLTVGIALGGLWAYEILGWGGYWAWDPVENASFIPWLTGTAFIHSVIVTERRGMMKAWSFALIIVTYCMTVVGTFLVRSGIIESVHAFGDTGVKLPFYFFMGVVFFGSLLLLLWRLPLLRSERKLESLLSREGIFLFNNLILLAIALVTIVITFWPVITETIYGKAGQETFGPDAYTMINAPLFLALLFLMGVGPILGWRQNSWRQIVRNFALPTAISTLVLVGYTGYLNKNDLFKHADSAETIAQLVTWVRVLMQVLIWPVCVFTFITVLQEFHAGAMARKRGTSEGYLRSMVGVTLQNRRRYGGYIVHIGMLMVAIGMYYSSFYENEGAVTAAPGGYAVLDDKYTRSSYLVYFDTEQRSSGWDTTRELFTRDEEAMATYRGMVRHVRQNPGKDAQQLIDEITADFKTRMGGDLPPEFEKSALPKMIKGIHWGVETRDNPRVFEAYETTIRVFPYERNVDEKQTDALLVAQHSLLLDFLGARDKLEQGQVPSPAELKTVLDEAVEAALPLGAELPGILAHVRGQIATLDDAKFIKAHSLRPDTGSAELSRIRTRVNEGLVLAHKMLEEETLATRALNVKALALKLPATKEQLAKQRPLSLLGLREALKVAPDSVKPAIEAEISEIVEGVPAISPTMRIFYNKRDGMPRVNEPIKDPAIEKTLTKDLYFVLMDVDEHDRARFRYFIKPHMTLGLFGLFVMVLGTAYCLLPTLTRKRPEVA